MVVTPTDGTPGGIGRRRKPSRTSKSNSREAAGSFEDIGRKAAFKLKFKKAEPFFGLRKLTLNNMTQDPSMIRRVARL